MSELAWTTTGTSHRAPARTACGNYLVVMTVGGSRGPVYRAHHLIGIAISEPLAQLRDSIDEAKADAQAHHDELQLQAAAAAKDPTAG